MSLARHGSRQHVAGAVRSAPTATRRAACAGGMLGSRLCTCPSRTIRCSFGLQLQAVDGRVWGSVAGYGPQMDR